MGVVVPGLLLKKDNLKVGNLHQDSGVVQRPRPPGAHCSLLPINQMPALTGELVLTYGVVLPPHESGIRKFSL